MCLRKMRWLQGPGCQACLSGLHGTLQDLGVPSQPSSGSGHPGLISAEARFSSRREPSASEWPSRPGRGCWAVKEERRWLQVWAGCSSRGQGDGQPETLAPSVTPTCGLLRTVYIAGESGSSFWQPSSRSRLRGRAGDDGVGCLRSGKTLYITGWGRGVSVVGRDEMTMQGGRGWGSKAGSQKQGAGDTGGARASGGEHGTRAAKGQGQAQTRGAQKNTQREGHRGHRHHVTHTTTTCKRPALSHTSRPARPSEN